MEAFLKTKKGKRYKMRLINSAHKKYKDISPVSNYKTFDECFTIYGGVLVFWFNTKDASTHVVKMKI